MLDGLEGIRFFRRFVGPVALHAGKAQGESAFVARAYLNFVESDFGDKLRLDVDGIAVASDFKFQQFLGLPEEHLVGKTFESLAQHGESALYGIACAQMQITQPAAPAAVAPFGGKDHQVKGTGLLYLEPTLPARSGGVDGISSFRHEAFVPLAEGAREKVFGLIGTCGREVRNDVSGGNNSSQSGEPLGLRLIDDRLAMEIQSIEPKRSHGEFGEQAIHLQLAAKAAHGHLERLGAALGIETKHFAIEDQVVRG